MRPLEMALVLHHTLFVFRCRPHLEAHCSLIAGRHVRDARRDIRMHRSGGHEKLVTAGYMATQLEVLLLFSPYIISICQAKHKRRSIHN